VLGGAVCREADRNPGNECDKGGKKLPDHRLPSPSLYSRPARKPLAAAIMTPMIKTIISRLSPPKKFCTGQAFYMVTYITPIASGRQFLVICCQLFEWP